MTTLDRLKLARDDFDQQEKLYNTLVLGMRFYVGTVALLGGWSLTLFKLEGLDTNRYTLAVIVTGVLFWCILLAAVYQRYQLFRGDHWTQPRTFDHYIAWESDRLKQLSSGEFETGTKTPAEFAEDEMLNQMTGAYAECASINRTANLGRQRRITWIGKLLLAAVLALGLQSGASMIYTHNHASRTKQTAAAATGQTTTAAPAGSGSR